jgi:hypothetical protein
MITLLVDELSENKISGYTLDNEKTKYNIDQIPDLEDTITKMIEKSKGKGMTFLFPAGRYIAIYQTNHNRSTERIFFFDHRANIMHAHLIHTQLITEDTVGKFRQMAEQMSHFFSEEFDNIELSDFLNPTTSYN